MNVLGLSCWFHDSSAALVVDGKVVAAVSEERFTRIKHDTTFPYKSIDYCLKSQGITFDDIDVVCFYEKPLLKLERVMQTGKVWQEKGTASVQDQVSHGLREGLFLDKVLKEDYGYTGRICYTQHHVAHAASSYYVSGFEEAAIITADGVGEWATTTKSIGRGSEIELLGEIHYPDSLGLFYSTITAFLGFKVNNDEYKVMGLASYGEPKYENEILKLINVFEDGSFKLNMEYFSFPYSNRRMYNRKIEEVLGEPRFAGDEVTQRHMNIASSAQKVLEDIMVKMATQFHKETGMDYLCMAGGVALNCVANWKIRERTPFKEVFVQPAAGDDGGCVGAALHAYYSITGEKPVVESCYDTWLGPDFSAEQILEVLKSEDAIYTQYSDDEIFKKTAELIADDNIIN
jgi:carbamoyltransferase